MRKGAEGLRPYNTKVFHTSLALGQSSERAVENITNQMESETSYDSLWTPVAKPLLAESSLA